MLKSITTVQGQTNEQTQHRKYLAAEHERIIPFKKIFLCGAVKNIWLGVQQDDIANFDITAVDTFIKSQQYQQVLKNSKSNLFRDTQTLSYY